MHIHTPDSAPYIATTPFLIHLPLGSPEGPKETTVQTDREITGWFQFSNSNHHEYVGTWLPVSFPQQACLLQNCHHSETRKFCHQLLSDYIIGIFLGCYIQRGSPHRHHFVVFAVNFYPEISIDSHVVSPNNNTLQKLQDNIKTKILTFLQSKHRGFPWPSWSLMLPFMTTPTSLLPNARLNPWQPLICFTSL